MEKLSKICIYEPGNSCLRGRTSTIVYHQSLFPSYFVLAEDGSPDSNWWNNNGSLPGYIDFTNPEAAQWWAGRIRSLIETYDIDSLKFDAGESSFSPQVKKHII